MASRLIMEVTTIKQPKISPLIKSMPQKANIQAKLINKDPKDISLKATTPQAPQATTPQAPQATTPQAPQATTPQAAAATVTLSAPLATAAISTVSCRTPTSAPKT
jgi:hypothetical protein